MKKSIAFLSTVAIAIFVVAACSKTNKATKRLIRAGEWKVTELSVDGTNEAELPKWEFSNCDPYEEVCVAKWENDEGGHADFAWQFNKDGAEFTISHQAEDEDAHAGHEHEHDHATEEAAAQAYAFSGKYSVVESDKNKMSFTSTSTVGYPGQTVVIVIEKK
ncbi:MAG: hypothetical protein DCO96_07680 [Fluviicola sp. XM-24bin1]|nr:MAG: hypothetical protein DCO96_07680 [Fluviicola sp. XM-24bin1]